MNGIDGAIVGPIGADNCQGLPTVDGEALEWLNQMETEARRAFAQDGELCPTAFIRVCAPGADGPFVVRLPLNFADDAATADSMGAVRDACAGMHTEAVVFVMEAWVVDTSAAKWGSALPPSQRPARQEQETVFVTLEVPGMILLRRIPILRGLDCAMLGEGHQHAIVVGVAGTTEGVPSEAVSFWVLPQNLALRAGNMGHD